LRPLWTAVVRAFSAMLLFTLLVRPDLAGAVPVFANGQGVSCETCHTTFPAMTRYGMMVMMTNFQILNEHLQMQALPLSMRLYITSMLANKSQPGSTQVSDLSLLGGGFMGRNFTWYVEQHAIDSGTIGATEQSWISWNGLFAGTNSLQAGKFHTPFPFMPAHAWTISDYLLAAQTTGQNGFNPNDARWGLAFNGMSNEFMYNLSYLTGSGPMGDALDYNSTKNPRTLDFNVSYGGMSIPYSVGIVGIGGTSPLHAPYTGLFDGLNGFTREGLYLGYQTNIWHFQTMYYHGFDDHPSPSEFNIPLNGYFFEAERDIGWRNHVLVRYDVASSDTLDRQYVLDLAHNIQPNLALIGELNTGPERRPQIAFQIAFAGPYQYGKRYLFAEPQGVHLVPAGAAAAAVPAAAPADDADQGARLVQASGCTGCHGATFQGALGPALYGIEHRLSPAAIAMHIKSPTPPMPNFGFTDAQIRDIVAYLSTLDGGTGAQSRPVVTFSPPVPETSATISVTFPGTPPRRVSAFPIMQMGNAKMHTQAVELAPSSQNPHLFTGRIVFSMGGPWIVRIDYDAESISVPVTVGSGT
jgi:mono/diheme cytochrome c family protein